MVVFLSRVLFPPTLGRPLERTTHQAFLSVSLGTVHEGTFHLLFFLCSIGVLVLWLGPVH